MVNKFKWRECPDTNKKLWLLVDSDGHNMICKLWDTKLLKKNPEIRFEIAIYANFSDECMKRELKADNLEDAKIEALTLVAEQFDNWLHDLKRSLKMCKYACDRLPEVFNFD
jgi:hypothetical protein